MAEQSDLEPERSSTPDSPLHQTVKRRVETKRLIEKKLSAPKELVKRRSKPKALKESVKETAVRKELKEYDRKSTRLSPIAKSPVKIPALSKRKREDFIIDDDDDDDEYQGFATFKKQATRRGKFLI